VRVETGFANLVRGLCASGRASWRRAVARDYEIHGEVYVFSFIS
jgi:hypothetical protein